MSEKEMDRAWYAAAKCQHVPMGACLTCIGASLAAAEERGRRAGIEERDELRARLWEALSVIESRAPDMTLLIPRIKVAREGNMSVLVDDKTAIVEQAEFNGMPEYSCSLPTGTIVGKRWKRREPYHLAEHYDWFMGEYVDIGSDKEIGIHWRRLYVV